VRDFLLDQPEVAKFRWKDTDFTKESVAAAAAAATPASNAPKSKKSKKNKKKNSEEL